MHAWSMRPRQPALLQIQTCCSAACSSSPVLLRCLCYPFCSPNDSYAWIPGSTGCLRCSKGVPRCVAGNIGGACTDDGSTGSPGQLCAFSGCQDGCPCCTRVLARHAWAVFLLKQLSKQCIPLFLTFSCPSPFSRLPRPQLRRQLQPQPVHATVQLLRHRALQAVRQLEQWRACGQHLRSAPAVPVCRGRLLRHRQPHLRQDLLRPRRQHHDRGPRPLDGQHQRRGPLRQLRLPPQ